VLPAKPNDLRRGMFAWGTMHCAFLHLRSQASAQPTGSATYRGLSVRDEGKASWPQVESSLREQAREAGASPSPGDEYARAIYRAAGADPDKMFADSQLVGFDVQAGQAVIARHTEGANYSIEVHRVHAGRHLVFKGSSSNAARYPSVRDAVLDTVSRFVPLAPGDIPDSDGFCTGNGVFALKARDDVGGDASLYVTFAEYPGLRFSLSLYGLSERGDKPSLMERVGRSVVLLALSGGTIRTLHRGSRRHAGQDGALMAVSMPLEGGGQGRAYKYYWHAVGVPLDPFRPEIEAELMTGTDKSSVDGDTVERLWRQIMESLESRAQ